MNRTDNPIACTLTPEAQPERRDMLHRLGQSIEEVQEREEGYAYRFSSDEILPELMTVIQAERQCCAFLRFALTLDPGNGPVWLEISGPEGTKAFLNGFFGLSDLTATG